MFFQPNKALATLGLAALPLAVYTHGLAVEGDVNPEFRANPSFAVRDGIQHTIFEHLGTGATIDYVKNSGICETTPGVNQYSGYITVGKNMSMWFWFFEARNAPSTAPLSLWLNGGPGCSSMIGLFEENGPCKFKEGATTPSLNPYSFNEYANMLYVDQPIGTGFSYGDNPVNSTVTAAPYVWNLLQVFFEHFPRYVSREFSIFTESYGGHYGPEIAYYIESQNKAISEGKIKGENIDLVALGIINGWYDAYTQLPEWINFSRYNSYYPLINDTIYEEYYSDTETECLPALKKCPRTDSNLKNCLAAQDACIAVENRYREYYDPNFKPYDIRQKGDLPFFPPSTQDEYLRDPEVLKAIGAQGIYSDCSNTSGAGFSATADSLRSILPELSSVVRSGVRTLILAGDADAVCDWFGGFAATNEIDYPGHEVFKAKPVSDYTVNGEVKGSFKSVDNLSWLRVYESGHKVPAFQPELALQVFKQTLQKKAIFST